jgi:hypothetical protein
VQSTRFRRLWHPACRRARSIPSMRVGKTTYNTARPLPLAIEPEAGAIVCVVIRGFPPSFSQLCSRTWLLLSHPPRYRGRPMGRRWCERLTKPLGQSGTLPRLV